MFKNLNINYINLKTCSFKSKFLISKTYKYLKINSRNYIKQLLFLIFLNIYIENCIIIPLLPMIKIKQL